MTGQPFQTIINYFTTNHSQLSSNMKPAINLGLESSHPTSIFQSRSFLLISLTLAVLFLFKSHQSSKKSQSKTDLSPLGGPKRESWLTGNRLVGKNLAPGAQMTEYMKEFGHVWIYPDGFGSQRLYISDYKALNAVLGDINNFEADAIRQEAMKFTVGDGIITRFGGEHKQQRKILGPAFSAGQLKALAPVFLTAAKDLADKVESIMNNGGESEWTKNPNEPIVDMVQWFNCASLNVIGLAGFGVDFEALTNGDENHQLARGFKRIVESTLGDANSGFFALLLFSIMYPKAFSWRVIERNRVIWKQNKLMAKVTDELVRTKSEEIKREMDMEKNNHSKSEIFSGKKDLLHLLLKSNMDPSLKPSERMSQELCRSQIQFFLFAGHETSATTSTWTLHYLSIHQEVQTSLRNHILANLDVLRSDLEAPEGKVIDNVILETLRLVLPVPYSERINVGEDLNIPLSEPVVGRDGEKISSVRVPKGMGIVLGLQQANLDERLFGPEPEEWRPSRWENLPEAHAKANMPAYGLYSFLGGPKVCIGNRFAIQEMRAFMIELLSRFKFEPDTSIKIRAQYAIVTKPVVDLPSSNSNEAPKSKAGMPLRVTRI